MEWLCSGEWDKSRKSPRYDGNSSYTSLAADKDIKICPKCNKVWEIYNIGCGKYTQFSYKDFPKYKKGRDKCARCRLDDGETFFTAWDRGKSKRIPFTRFNIRYKERDVRAQKIK